MNSIKKHGVKIALIIVGIGIIFLILAIRAEASTPQIALVDQVPWHVALMRQVLGDTPFVHYPQGAAIGIEQASRDGMQIIVVPGWLDNSGVRGDCLPVGYIGGPLNALKTASKTSQVFIGAADCPLFRPWATTVAALDKSGNRPEYLPPVEYADIWIEACDFGYCSDSEAILKAGIMALGE